MPIDVEARRHVPVPQPRVAAYAMDHRNDPAWTQGIRRAELTREADGGGLGVGAEVTRTAYFLGRRIDYVLRVEALTDEVLDMRSVAAPFPMHVTYTFRPDGDGTDASIRVRGGPGGVVLAAPGDAGPAQHRPRPAGPGAAASSVREERGGGEGVEGRPCRLRPRPPGSAPCRAPRCGPASSPRCRRGGP